MQNIVISKDVLALIQKTAEKQFGTKQPQKQVTFGEGVVEGQAKKKKKTRQRVKKEKAALSREQEIQRSKRSVITLRLLDQPNRPLGNDGVPTGPGERRPTAGDQGGVH